MNAKETILEVTYAILPITLLITVLQFTVCRLPMDVFMQFIGGVILVMLGLILFLIGVKVGFLPMGELIGSTLMSRRKVSIILLAGLLIGFVVTVAEPDVQVMALQVDNVAGGIMNKQFLVLFVALGVGIFSALALIRMFLNIPIAHVLCGCYVVALLLAFFAPPEFLAISFDAGGATTGPITVPFILSLGVGISAVTGTRNNSSGSFGLLGLASIGPILAVLLLGVFYR